MMGNGGLCSLSNKLMLTDYLVFDTHKFYNKGLLLIKQKKNQINNKLHTWVTVNLPNELKSFNNLDVKIIKKYIDSELNNLLITYNLKEIISELDYNSSINEIVGFIYYREFIFTDPVYVEFKIKI